MAQETPTGTIAANPDDARRAPRRSRGRSRGGGAPVVVNTVLVVLIVGLVAAAWFILTQQERLDASQRTLDEATTRIQALEDRLRMTDETLSESDADTSKQIAFWDSEIRKLWDVSNKRNRGWIETNRANITKLTSSIGAAQTELNTIKGTVTRLDSTVQGQQEIGDRVTALDMQMQRLLRTQQDLVDRSNQAVQASASLRAALEVRVRDNEEAIAAIDAHRTRVNNDIVELRRAVNARSVGP
ncbi:MAG: hypothetical protein OXG82_20645 [Gammaproteobacteria bacterium]|nr:hypothetical protein [Gammaproteobacteria bacterium]